MSRTNDNILQPTPEALVNYLRITREARLAVTRSLKSEMAAEHSLDGKNLLQAAIDLLQLDNKISVHFET